MSCLPVRSVASAAFTFAAVTSFTSTAVAVVSVTSAASACVYKFSVESLCEFLFCSFADSKDLAFEMKGLTGHLMVKVHLDTVFGHFNYHAWNHTSHAVHHRNCVAWNKEVFAYFSIDFECSLRKVNDPAWINLTIAVSRC